MKKRILKLSAFALLIFTTACSHKYYTANNIEQYQIKTVAILPVEMEFTGNMPKKLTAADIAKMEESESKMFQRSLYGNILNMVSSNKKKPSTVQFQSIDKTLQLLQSNNISIRDAWTADPSELAKILQVDAVVKTHIVTHRLMSDAASAGFSVLNDVLWGVRDKVPVGSNAPTKTNDVVATCSLAYNGNTIWNDKYVREANWKNQPQEVIDEITRKFAQHFPHM